MEKRELDKSETRTVSLPLSVWNDVEKRANENYGGKRSSYIKALVSGDIGPRTNMCQVGENIVVDLVRHYRPAMLEETKMHMEGINQERFLDKIIEQVNAFMNSSDSNSASNIVIISKELYAELIKASGREKIGELAEKWKGLRDFGIPLNEMFGTESLTSTSKSLTASVEESSRKPHKSKHKTE